MGAETFWDRVALYNEALWPVQAALILATVFLTYRVIAKPGPRTDVWMKAFLSFAFAWVDRKVFVALIPWALLGLPKCFGALDCCEDCILFASGVYGLIVLLRTWKAQSSAGGAVVRSAL